MIKYALRCKKGHVFDAWFPSSDAFDKQCKRKLVSCATCATTDVEKALMAPRLKGVRQNKRSDDVPTPKARGRKSAAAPTATPLVAAELSKPHREMLEAMRRLRKEVEETSEYVGSSFAEEARKIHHEEVPARGIYGEATPEETKALLDEGVSVYPLPMLPEDKN